VAVNTHTLTIPSSTRFLEEVREFVATHAKDADFSEMVVEQIKMAVDEACTNVIEHSYEGKTEQKVDISVKIDSEKLVVIIRDTGREFDRKAYKEPDLIHFAKTKKSGGFGVHIMRKLMDDVEYRHRAGVNECCLTKYRT